MSIKQNKILDDIIEYHLSEIPSIKLLDIVDKFMRDYENIMSIERPSTADSNINALYWNQSSRKGLINFLDILYKPLKRNKLNE